MHGFDNLSLDNVLRADRVLNALLGSLRMSPKLAVKLTLRSKNGGEDRRRLARLRGGKRLGGGRAGCGGAAYLDSVFESHVAGRG